MTARPRDLLTWFLEGYRAETPTEMHSGAVFIGRHEQPGRETLWAKHSKPADLVGGSHLGSPGDEPTFRRLMEDGAFATEVAEYEGHKDTVNHYRFPMRAAIARLAGRGDARQNYPFMARFLYRTACRDGDWQAAARSMGIVEQVAPFYLEASLHRLWSKYEVEPPARPIRTEEAA